MMGFRSGLDALCDVSLPDVGSERLASHLSMSLLLKTLICRQLTEAPGVQKQDWCHNGSTAAGGLIGGYEVNCSEYHSASLVLPVRPHCAE